MRNDNESESTVTQFLSISLWEAMAEGKKINDEISEFLKKKTWSPATALLLVCGIKPKPRQSAIPDSAIGLDGRKLQKSNSRLMQARRLFVLWKDYWEDEEEPRQISPFQFFIWCDENQIETEWLRQVQALAGFGVSDRFDRTYAAMAMIMNAQLANGILDATDFTSTNRFTKTGQKWTAETEAELRKYKLNYGLKKTATHYRISETRVGQVLKKNFAKGPMQGMATLLGSMTKRK